MEVRTRLVQGFFVVVTLTQLGWVLLWIPAVRNTLAEHLGVGGTPYLALPVAAMLVGAALALRVTSESKRFDATRIHGAGLGLFVSGLTLTLADATGVDMSDWDVNAFADGPAAAGLSWRLMGTVLLPASLGFVLDGSITPVAGTLLKPLRFLPRRDQALASGFLGLLAGAGTAYFLWSETAARYIADGYDLYWATLGDYGGIVAPIGAGLLLQFIRRNR